MTQFLYIADPMCSWCYGFGPELLALLETMPEARIDIVLGGLRAYNKDVMDAEKRAMILGHWQQVEQASGLPFTRNGMAQPNFIYDTEPACRAVVAARILDDDLPGKSLLTVFHAIQHAFYAEGQDVTDLQVLAQVASAALNLAADTDSFDAQSFYETLSAPATMTETAHDFEQVQRWGISGFPALLLVQPDGLHMIAAGYTKTANLITALSQIPVAE